MSPLAPRYLAPTLETLAEEVFVLLSGPRVRTVGVDRRVPGLPSTVVMASHWLASLP